MESKIGEEVDGSGQGSKLRQCIAVFVVNLISVGYGFAIAWPSTALPELQTPTSPLRLSTEEASWVASLICLGGLVGNPLYSCLPNLVGRKMSGYLTAAPLLICWLLVHFASSPAWLYAARFLAGFNGAAAIVIVPLYVAEIAQDDIRGAFGTCFGIMTNAGITVSYALGSFVSINTLNYINIALCVVFILTFFWLPETPQYLLKCGKTDQALVSLQWFRGKKADITAEFQRMKVSLKGTESQEEQSTSFKGVLSSRASVLGVMIVVVLCMNQQLSGIFPILNYTVNIFRESGSDISPNVATIIVGFLQIPGNLLSLALVDRLGRRPLLVASNVIIALSLVCLGVYFYLKSAGIDVAAIGWLPLASLSAYILAVSAGVGPLLYVVMTEIVSPHMQGLTSSIGFSMTWTIAFLLTKFFPVINDLLGIYGCFWMFSGFCILCMVFIIWKLPETKGRSIESIISQLNNNNKIQQNVAVS